MVTFGRLLAAERVKIPSFPGPASYHYYKTCLSRSSTGGETEIPTEAQSIRRARRASDVESSPF